MYKAKLNKLETQKAIFEVEKTFKKLFEEKMNVMQVKGPLIVASATGLNDDLSGVENALSFTYEKEKVEVAQSLAKWKRYELGQLGITKGNGLYIDMNAIRKDESKVSPYHSLYVDQYDWEKVITKTDRKLDYLFETVKTIYEVMKATKKAISKKYPVLNAKMAKDIVFISSEELRKEFPKLTPEEREQQAAKKHGAIFVYQIGHPLKDGVKHGARAADYDDWKLNGDIIVWDTVRQYALELSSMGIRVDKKSLKEQLIIAKETQKESLPFHKAVLEDKLPLSIGGGIGRSRLNLFMLEKAHIGEVQPSFWPKKHLEDMKKLGIEML